MTQIEQYQLTPDLNICRILNGMWQVAGGHGHIDINAAIEDMISYHEFGFTTWDLADIYGPAEEYIGKFRHRIEILRGEKELEKIIAFTKFVPNPGPMMRPIVERAINRSISKMNVTKLDLVQFHWWDYDDSNYIEALHQLTRLRDEGKIRHVGLTNFDTERMEIMADNGFKLVTNQIQYSIIDQRPDVKMASFCKKHGISLLTYGTLCGGLLSEKYLGKTEPTRAELNTLSLQKYKNMINVWGGWDLFQKLLATLSEIAKKHHVSIANVAVRYILDKPQVAGVIVGTRLGLSEHKNDNARVLDLRLDNDDIQRIDEFSRKSHDLFLTIGDCGSEYR